ncbi:MAG: DUF1893 domain-containing protein [Candidatus Bathyarchaeia archaeon]|jgi:hypothetical protein
MSVDASDDLDLAKRTLREEDLSLAVAKNGGVLFRSKSHGVSDLLAMVSDIGRLAEGSSLADSIVGRAAALLCIYSKIIAVYGANMSEGALSVFKANGIKCEYGTLVPKILNRKKNDICPFDKAVLGTDDPNVALDRLRSLRL